MSSNVNVRYLIYAAALLQIGYMICVQVLSTVISVDIRSLHLAAGILGGTVVGIALTGKVPGITWPKKQFESVEAASYGAVAAVLGTVGFFVLVAGYGVASTLMRNGVFAPQIILTAVGAIGLAYVVFHLVEGIIIGTVSFWIASLLR